jgi:hypothetical protein
MSNRFKIQNPTSEGESRKQKDKMASVAVASMLFADSCRSLAVTDAASALPIPVNKHLNKHAFGWCCLSSNNSNAGETVSSTTVAGNLTATSSSNRYYLYFHLFFSTF